MQKRQSKKQKDLFRGIEYESDTELHTLYYLFELLDAGLVKSIERAETFKLSDRRDIKYNEYKKLKNSTKIIPKIYNLIREHVYTPEFKVIFTQEAIYKFIDYSSIDIKPIKPFLHTTSEIGLPVVYIECKNKFDFNNMSRLFKINQKWMYEKYKIFVNLIIPEDLFKSTFTPQEYLKTPTGKDKKINYKPIKTLKEYLEL